MDPRDVDQAYGEVTRSKIEWIWTIGNFARCERTKHKRCITSPPFTETDERYGNITCRLLLFPHGSADASPDDTSIYLFIEELSNREAVYGGFECWLSRIIDSELEEIVATQHIHDKFEIGYGYGFCDFCKFKTIVDPAKKLCSDNRLVIHFTIDFTDNCHIARNKNSPERDVPVSSDRKDKNKLYLAEMMQKLSVDDNQQATRQCANIIDNVNKSTNGNPP